MKLGENTRMNIGIIPTGSLNLDNALGIGGVPRGRIVRFTEQKVLGKQLLLYIL